MRGISGGNKTGEIDRIFFSRPLKRDEETAANPDATSRALKKKRHFAFSELRVPTNQDDAFERLHDGSLFAPPCVFKLVDRT